MHWWCFPPKGKPLGAPTLTSIYLVYSVIGPLSQVLEVPGPSVIPEPYLCQAGPGLVIMISKLISMFLIGVKDNSGLSQRAGGCEIGLTTSDCHWEQQDDLQARAGFHSFHEPEAGGSYLCLLRKTRPQKGAYQVNDADSNVSLASVHWANQGTQSDLLGKQIYCTWSGPLPSSKLSTQDPNQKIKSFQLYILWFNIDSYPGLTQHLSNKYYVLFML